MQHPQHKRFAFPWLPVRLCSAVETPGARVSSDPTGGTCPRISPSSQRGAGDKRNSRPIAIKQPRQELLAYVGNSRRCDDRLRAA